MLSTVYNVLRKVISDAVHGTYNISKNSLLRLSLSTKSRVRCKFEAYDINIEGALSWALLIGDIYLFRLLFAA